MTSFSFRNMPKSYDPKSVEGRLYAWWESSGFFKPKIEKSRKPFTVIMPPPNVTGELHAGHALTTTIEDAFIRYHRMLGDSTLWVPGSDHAGIATQMVVERDLAKHGVSKESLGREKFLEKVWEWVNHYGGAIDNQLRRMGASCDWTRKSFTLDDGPSNSVRTTFKNLYEKGLIYRGERMINWDPSLETVLSDLEVEYSEIEGSLYYIRYPLINSNDFIVVATTRPETLLADTAVAVNPNDSRYSSLSETMLSLPIVHRDIPLIFDDSVDPDFGTGALKITPGHDPNDYEVGLRHSLPVLNILDKNGCLNSNAGAYNGLDRFEARKRILNELEINGLLEKVVPHLHSVGHSQRSGVVVEPLISTQWFINVKPLAEKAAKAVTSGKIKIVPERFQKVYLNWMNNIRDWCISRQLWWGHRIPVWYCDECNAVNVSVSKLTQCGFCSSEYLTQDDDVLDTWFSSGLWTHSTLGWPEPNDDFDYFYPTNLMETGYDILFFWVARMIMLGLENTGEVPFDTVYLHGLVRDQDGQKMSKTKGNVVDPLIAIETYGTDALRYALGTGGAPGNDMRLSSERMESARNFANKIWNATRFVLSSIQDRPLTGWHMNPPQLHQEDQWILTRIDQLTEQVNSLWENMQLGEAQRAIHDFLWNEFCDWYVEMAKVRIKDDELDPCLVLPNVLERSLRLLHPFMPFITEELWQHLMSELPNEGSFPDSIMLASYPVSSGMPRHLKSIERMSLFIDLVRAVRNVRAEFRIGSSEGLDVYIEGPGTEILIRDAGKALKTLAKISNLYQGSSPITQSIKTVVQESTISIPTSGVIDIDLEITRLTQELKENEQYLKGLNSRLSNQGFLENAPQEVVEKERERQKEGVSRQEKINYLLKDLNSSK